MRILSELETIQHNFAKVYADKGAYIIKVKIGDAWVDKAFVKRCPRCNQKIPRGLAAGGIEYCRARNCHYKRRVFSMEEWQAVFNR